MNEIKSNRTFFVSILLIIIILTSLFTIIEHKEKHQNDKNIYPVDLQTTGKYKF
jgi:hypothetical protein